MMRRVVEGLWSCALVCALALSSAWSQAAEVSSSGAVRWSGGQEFIREMEFSVRAKDWTMFRQVRGLRRPDEGRVSFGVPLSRPLKEGEAQVEMRLSASPSGERVDCTVTFDAAQTLQGSLLSVSLKASALAGRQGLLVPSLKPVSFPGERQSGHGVASFHGLGLALRRADGRYDVITQAHAASVLVQDSRAFGSDSFELRFQVGPSQVRPGVPYRNSVSVRVMDEAALREAYRSEPPKFGDLTSALLLVADEGNGCIRLRDGDRRLLDMEVAVHGLNWSYNSQSQSRGWSASGDTLTSRRFLGSITVPQTEGRTLDVDETLTTDRAFRTARVDYALELKEPLRLNGYQLSLTVPLSEYAGQTAVLDTETGERRQLLPEILGNAMPFSGMVRRIRLPHAQPHRSLDIAFDRPVSLLMQDNRGWGGTTMEFRVMFRRAESGVEEPAGRRTLQVTVRAGDEAHPLTVLPDTMSLSSVTDTSDWFPYVLAWDRPAPVSVSFLNENDAPAGRHGFVGVRDGRLVTLGNGQPIRFWGTCLSAGANFPTHEQAELIARRLASYGVNMVRTHHADAAWAERHFFRRDRDHTREFDPESLDRFDYFMACLKREGIYIYLDQLVNRRFKAGDGVDSPDELPVCGKPYSYFDRRLIELQKEFSKALWTHVNPYTGLAYKDDPAVALMEFANENDLFSQPVTLEPYRTRLEARYREWAAAQGVELPEGKIDFRNRTDAMTRFFIQVMDAYHEEMGAYLRGIGVRIPMTGSNWTRGSQLLASLAKLDYTDSHSYWNHPQPSGTFGTNPMLGSAGTIMDGLGFQKMEGKPFFVSEWDAPWPYEFRAELPAWMAAVASFQDWDGLAVYTYRHSSVPTDFISGAFETFNDPARFGLFPAAALIYRRQDVSVGRAPVTLALDPKAAESAKAPGYWSYPALRGLTGRRRVASSFAAGTGEGGEGGDDATITLTTPAFGGGEQVSEGGQIRHRNRERTLWIDSPRSVVISSFFRSGEDYEVAGRLKVRVSADRFGTVAVSSLTDEPVATSRRLLVTVAGRAENTGFEYSLLRNRRRHTGRGPILCEPVRPDISLATGVAGLKVRPVSDRGERLAPQASSSAGGWLSFRADAPTIYYLVEAE